MSGSMGAGVGQHLDVVLFTSKAAGDYMQEMVLGLREKGIASEVVAGAELDTELSIDAMRRYRRGGLYVLCKDGDLDDDGAERVRQNLLHSRKVDEQHIVTITLRNKSMSSHASAVATKAKLLGQRQPPGATRGPGAGTLSAMATLGKVRTSDSLSAPIDDEAKTTVARNLLLNTPKSAAPLATARPPASYAPKAPSPLSHGELKAKVRPAAKAKMPPMKKSEPVATVPKVDSATQLSKPAAAELPEPVAAPEERLPPATSSAPQPPPAVAPSPSPLVTAESAAEVDYEDLEDVGTPRSRTTLIVAAASVLVAMGVAAALLMMPGDEQVTADKVETKVGDKSAEEVVQAAQAKLAEEKAIEAAAEKEAAAAAAAAKKKADAEYAKEREAAAAAAAAAAAEGAKGGETGAEEGDGLALEDDPAEVAVEDEDALIAKALESKELRSLDNVIVDPRRSKKGVYQDGLAYCEGRDAYGVKGWRMPQIGEISALVGARMVVKDYYWTQTPGDTAGIRQLVYDSKHGKIKSMSPKFTGARTVCVRPRKL